VDEFQESPSSRKSSKVRKQESLTVGPRGLDSVGEVPGLHVCICVPGWLQDRAYGSALDQFEGSLAADVPCSQHVVLRWDSRRLYEMSLAFAKFWASKATVTTIQQAYPHALAAASSVAGAVAFAFALPLTVISCLDYIDNPWSVLLSRANAAGEALADVLVERSYGQRPVTLVGYSLGARVIFKCLESLAARGELGIVDNVYLLGAPVSADPERWKKVLPVVAGRIVHGYMAADWALAFFHRGCGHGVYVAGLRRVDVEGVENFDMALLGIDGHRDLKDCLPRAVRAIGVGSGYTVMPPAPLVPRRTSRAKKATANAGDAIVDVSDNKSDAGASSRPSGSASRSSDARASSAPPAHEDSSPPRLLQLTDGETCRSASPSRDMEVDSQWADDLEQMSAVAKDKSRAAEDAGRRGAKEKKKKKKKVPAWLSSLGAPWGGSGGGSNSSGNVAGDSGPAAPPPAPHERPRDTSQSSSSTQKGAVNGDAEWVPPPIVDPDSADAVVDNGDDDLHEDGMGAEGEIAEDAASDGGGGGGGGSGGFDWELQRRIWEEQERQLRENGVANAVVNIETGTKVVLGIGVELTGRRLKNFVPQDTELPAPCATDVYTNCVDEQEGILFRLYEHEIRTKYLPLNPYAPDADKYPKLLGELTLRWPSRAPKGKLRFAVSVAVDEAGDVVARAEERLREGGVGETAELTVRRADLCTMHERRELEAAENRRLAAEAAAAADEQALNKNVLLLEAPEQQTVLALPAPPPSSSAGSVPNAGTSEGRAPQHAATGGGPTGEK
jgi:hypothetical protein